VQKIIARETVKSSQKRCDCKCYGGDITRKEKTTGETEKRVRKRMRQIGNVRSPSSQAFLAVLKLD